MIIVILSTLFLGYWELELHGAVCRLITVIGQTLTDVLPPNDLDYKLLIIDATFVKVHPHASVARGGNQGMGHTKGG